MRILLINPPVPNNKNWIREGRCQQIDIWGAPFPPMSLALISTSLVQHNHETLIIDAGPESKTIDDVIQTAKIFKPDFIILTTVTATIATDLDWFCKTIKSHFQKIQIAAVGVHVSALPEETLQSFPDLDFAIIGEPELTCQELADNLKSKKFDSITGLAFRNEDNTITTNSPRSFNDTIDDFGFPDWEKINFKNYLMPIIGKPFSMIHFARGCPYKCEYCTAHTYNGRSYRMHSVEHVIAEIKFNMSLGVCDFLFWTELLTFDSKYLNSILDQLIETGLNKKIRWVCNSRVDTVTADILKKMKLAGCWQIAFGFEFGTDEMLFKVQKGGKASVDLAKKSAKLAADAGLVVDGHFMLGYPGENKDQIQKTIELSLRLPLTFSHFYSVVPYPGAQIYSDWVMKSGGTQNSIHKKIDWKNFDQRKPVHYADGLHPDEIKKMQLLAYRKFYLRPVIVFKVLKIAKNITQFLNLIKSFFQVTKHLIFEK